MGPHLTTDITRLVATDPVELLGRSRPPVWHRATTSCRELVYGKKIPVTGLVKRATTRAGSAGALPAPVRLYCPCSGDRRTSGRSLRCRVDSWVQDRSVVLKTGTSRSGSSDPTSSKVHRTPHFSKAPPAFTHTSHFPIDITTFTPGIRRLPRGRPQQFPAEESVQFLFPGSIYKVPNQTQFDRKYRCHYNAWDSTGNSGQPLGGLNTQSSIYRVTEGQTEAFVP
ncbi:hypothetical protein FIBSPDRAFT_902715 [Athelia psychrophila]|uniref:Uncharacterized protein n=1 Tax=Athelia psychrophila TaxID=1759441 RepID=A0A167WW93_9AGAM|nr:hypothetical protein FIBSPDRAFT_902715 [Fibularhizoctonia sp. CBS 109695]